MKGSLKASMLYPYAGNYCTISQTHIPLLVEPIILLQAIHAISPALWSSSASTMRNLTAHHCCQITSYNGYNLTTREPRLRGFGILQGVQINVLGRICSTDAR